MTDREKAALRAGVREILNRHPAVGLAVAVVRDGRPVYFHGHGRADLASGVPVTEDTVFRIGSITKTCTAIAVMRLYEQGALDLDAPARHHLRAYRLLTARPGHPPPTIRQLLTHTAGLPELVHPSRALIPVLGETVRYGRPVPSLAAFYRGGLRLVAEPGTRHTYSNHGFATLGQIVQDVTGEPLEDHLREHVFTPLGMTATSLRRPDGPHRATGYTLRAAGPRPVAERDLITAGAGGIYSTARDMARYVAALAGGGSNEHGTVLKPDTLAAMYAPQYRPDPRVPGAGLAFFRQEAGGHLIVEHDGLMPGFNSQLAVAPGDGAGVVAFTNGARGARSWLGVEMTGLLRRMLGIPEDVIRTGLPHHPEIWGALCGRYAFPGSLRDVQRWFIGGVEVAVRRGRLTLRVLTPVPGLERVFPLHPDDDDDPYVFRVDLARLGMGTTRVVFGRGRYGVTACHLGFAPLSFHRRRPAAPWRR